MAKRKTDPQNDPRNDPNNLRRFDVQKVKEFQRSQRIQEGIGVGLPGAGRNRIVPDKTKYGRKDKFNKNFDKEAFSPASLAEGDCLVLDDGFFQVRHASASHLHLEGPYEQILTDCGQGPYGWASVLASRIVDGPWYSSKEAAKVTVNGEEREGSFHHNGDVLFMARKGQFEMGDFAHVGESSKGRVTMKVHSITPKPGGEMVFLTRLG